MKKRLKTLSIILVSTFVSGVSLLFFSSPPLLLDGVSFSKAVYDDSGHLLRLTLNDDSKYRLFVPLKEIPPALISATLLQEDQFFYQHIGINPLAMLKAIWQTYVLHSRRMGASTISMQVAHLRYGIYSRSVLGKLLQIARALQLEWHYSKDQILEAYLNLAPYGGNIEGAGAASLVYFHKAISHASLPDILTLSVIPQNPTQRSSDKDKLAKSRAKLFSRWIEKHPQDRGKQALINLPITLHTPQQLPFIAPHFVNQLLLSTDDREIKTTLNVPLQTLLERITRHYIKRKQTLGINNAAVMLLDTRDMGIKGLVGSGNFFDKNISGQINGAEIKRSPGSTLKPFIYALALDQGLIHPLTMLKDVPHSFGNYNPENFDYDFMGPISAKDALIMSRNIPAIFLASQLHQPTLYEFLVNAQVKQLRSESFYGLALTLGGAELTMHELVSLYAVLVNEGWWKPLRAKQNETYAVSKRLLSPEASFLVLDMLRDTPHPDGGYLKQRSIVSWKTGTSSAFRDAWSLGSFGPYVLAVWVGNFNNQSNPALIGKKIAAPLFFEIIESMSHEISALPLLNHVPTSMNLVKIDVCRASGMLPTRYCLDTEKTWFIHGKSPIKSDTIFREIAIDSRTGLRTCHSDEYTRFEIYEFWPTDLLRIFKQAGIQRRTPPFYNRDCPNSSNLIAKPQITSPRSQLRYIVRTNNTQQLIPFSAVVDSDVRYLYWFANETFLGKIPRDTPYMWQAKSGKFVIRVVDDHGQADAQDVEVLVDS